jgi:hypothetical protein
VDDQCGLAQEAEVKATYKAMFTPTIERSSVEKRNRLLPGATPSIR